jgi:hypothetical protein
VTDDRSRPTDDGPPGGWAGDDEPPRERGSRLPALSARVLVCFVLGFVGMYAALVAFGALGVPALLLLIVLGLAGAYVEPRRAGFGWAIAGVAACLSLETMLYLQVRAPADAAYDALAPVVVVGGTALVALLMGSGWLLRRLLSDSAPDRTIDG